MVVALFAPPLEAWIRWVAPFYALTITFRKPNCAHLASDSVVDQATSSVLQAACCVLLVVVVVVRAKPTQNIIQKTKTQTSFTY